MTLPFQTLNTDLFTRAQALLDDDWLAHDADLAPVLPTVLARGVGQDWHKAGTFRHHLIGVARSLALWQQPRHVRRSACCTACTATRLSIWSSSTSPPNAGACRR